MARGKLFEYAVLYHPKEKKDSNGNVEDQASKLLVEPTRVVATDEKSVAIMASKKIPNEYDSKLDLVEIIVRPF